MPFTLNGKTKLVMLFMATRSPIKAITSVQRVGKGMQKTRVNGFNETMISRNIILRLNLILNLVSDGKNVLCIALIQLFFIYKIQKL